MSESPQQKRRKIDTQELFTKIFDLLDTEIDKADLKKQSGKGNLTSIKKLVTRVQKTGCKKLKPSDTNMNSGFNKKTPVVDAMCDFAGWTRGSEHTRTDITRFLCAYIKTNDLQRPDKRREIVPDLALGKLLDYNEALGPLTFCSIQGLINPLFIKEVVPVSV